MCNVSMYTCMYLFPMWFCTQVFYFISISSFIIFICYVPALCLIMFYFIFMYFAFFLILWANFSSRIMSYSYFCW